MKNYPSLLIVHFYFFINMRKYLIIVIALFSGLFSCFSQEEQPVNLSYRSSMIGIGGVSVYDTYLSPLEYTGTSFGFMQENMKMTGLLKGNVAGQQLFNIDFSSIENPSKNSTEYTGFLEYSYGLFCRFAPVSNLKIYTGSQINGIAGFIYNTRNSNNPATGKAHINLALSGAASYDFNIKFQPFRVRYQISSPFVGIMFSPHYGQSYYEISLGDDDHLVHFASYHNQVILRNSLSLEIPLDFITLRLMYVNSIYETRVNEIDTRIHNNSFMIGFSKEVFTVSGKKQAKGKYKRVFE